MKIYQGEVYIKKGDPIIDLDDPEFITFVDKDDTTIFLERGILEDILETIKIEKEYQKSLEKNICSS